MDDHSNRDVYVLTDVFTDIELAKDWSMRIKVSNVFGEQVYSKPFGGADYDLKWPGREFALDVLYTF